MKKSSKIMLSAALVMIILAMMIPAWSYFTTYAVARGGQIIHLGEHSEIKEDYTPGSKQLQVSNTDENVTVFVRARAYAGIPVSYTGTGWTAGNDGFWYYGTQAAPTAVAPGGRTNILNVNFTVPTAEEDGEFNIVLIYESTPVRYNADGSLKAADWGEKLTVIEEGGN